MNRIWACAFGGVLTLLLGMTFSRSASAATFRTVALTGQVAPGASPSLFADFHLPMVDNAGRTGFHATIGGSQSVWSESSGNLALVARAGQAAPGTPVGGQFNSFNGPTPLVNYANGHTAFRGFLTGTTTGDGIWSTGAGALTLVARESLPAPGTPNGVRFDSFVLPRGIAPAPLLNNAGQTAFAATLTGTGVNTTNDEGIWAERSGTLNLVARAGNQAPGTPTGVQFSFFGPDFSFNDHAQTAFLANLMGSGVTSGNNQGIFSEGSGVLTLVARRGQQAPGAESGALFGDFNEPALNSAGRVAFAGALTGVATLSNRGIWTNRSGTLDLVVRSGSPAPGLGDPRTFTGFRMPVINAAGHLAFNASVIGPGMPSSDGVWLERSGKLVAIAHEGSPAVGLPANVLFSSVGPPVLNASGQIAFWADVSGPGIGAANNRGLWATGPAGRLKLLVAEGQTVEIEPLDARTVSAINLYTNTGNEDGRRSSFNDRGQITFMLTFTDGSRGVFVSDQVMIPEPVSWQLIAVGLFAICSHFRRGSS